MQVSTEIYLKKDDFSHFFADFSVDSELETHFTHSYDS
ncbi:hypothetical protein F652_490 [Enterobacteriaceae bacterium bta3-1]|nr:hypothetical protein F652_490 [Enterobacteriaceae bacterium bta3-1]